MFHVLFLVCVIECTCTFMFHRMYLYSFRTYFEYTFIYILECTGILLPVCKSCSEICSKLKISICDRWEGNISEVIKKYSTRLIFSQRSRSYWSKIRLERKVLNMNHICRSLVLWENSIWGRGTDFSFSSRYQTSEVSRRSKLSTRRYYVFKTCELIWYCITIHVIVVLYMVL